MGLALTELAARHVRQYADKRQKAFAGIRLAVKPSGCSGLSYVLEYADDLKTGEISFESNGIRIITDPKSYQYIDGTVLDYVREGVQEGFRFNNPNVKSACGCGESFNT